jgi:ribose/xylose/arabinose/galactoside ABC-type transport system permease subunit
MGSKINVTTLRLRGLHWTADGVQNLTIFGIFIALCIVGIMFEPQKFLMRQNITNIFVSSSSIIMVAAPITLVLMSGNLDLSVGGVGAMGGVLFGLMTHYGMNIPLAMLLAIMCGGACGFLSGLSISALALPSFIISLAFKYIGRGIALIGANGAVVFGIPKEVENISLTLFGWLPLPMVYAIVVVLIFMFIQSRTVFGSMCYVTGANLKAAKLSGISDKVTVTGVFSLAGIMAAFAGIVLTSRVIAADSGNFPSLESDCIIAAVLGGTDINGGSGTVFGMLIGALFITVLTNILNMQGITQYLQNVVKGIVLILAISLNYIIKKRIRV